jgi:hypothetical protein
VVGRGGAERESGDSLLLVSVDVREHAADTIARLGGLLSYRSANGRAPAAGMGTGTLDTEDQALLFPDGWVAQVVVRPYHVRWRNSAGKWVTGPPLEDPVVRATGEHACHVHRARPAGGRPRPCDPAAMPAGPELVPPFLLQWTSITPILLGAPDGSLLIARTPDGSGTNRYDIVDRSGHRTARLELTGGSWIVAFGATSVYVAVDRGGSQELRRYPWPPAPPLPR